MNATADKFGHPHSLVGEWPRWLALLRPAQPTLGSLVLVCREPVVRFGAISVEAAAELRDAVAAVERALGELLRFDKINYLMLMMVDPDVHFHVIPRYTGSRSFGALSFVDTGWPGPPALEPAVALDSATIDGLVARLREAWQAAPTS